jgi:rhamnogalacturonyl hydrolase YesR
MKVLHGYGWGRGQGWALLGLVDLLERLPAATEGRPRLLDDLHQLAAGVRDSQDAGGLWHTLIHDRTATSRRRLQRSSARR